MARRNPRATWLALVAVGVVLILARAGLRRSRALAHVREGTPIVRELEGIRLLVRDQRRELASWVDERDAVGRLDESARSAKLEELRASEDRLETRADAARAVLSRFDAVSSHYEVREDRSPGR